MAQIKKRFIAPNAIDGSKLRFLNNEAVRALGADGSDIELLKLTSSNVLQFLRTPQVSVDPTFDNDISRKSYVDSQVSNEAVVRQQADAAEQAAREQADAGLQSQINTEKGRIDAILLASDADKDSFAEIVQLINSVDTTNDQAFASYVLSNDAALAQEVSDRQAAVTAEAAARSSGDMTLQGNLDAEQSAREAADAALDARLDVLEADPVTKSYVDDADQDLQDQIDALSISAGGDVAAEQAARIAADNALDARLDVIEGADTVEGSVAKAEKDAKDHADSIVASEQAAREQADAGLQSQIDTEKSRIDAILLASDADKDSFAEIVQLINSVDTTNDNAFASYVLSNDAALAQEISDRQSGDNQLQSNINAEQSARELADSNLQSAINQEVSDRQAAVSSEASARSAADATLQSNINAEQSARQAADAAEQAAREAADAAEAAARAAELPRHAKFATTLSSTDVSNGYVDLLHVVLPSSVHVFIDRLACHEDTDYTLSTVNNKTRVTFSSSFMSSEEAAQAGDLLRCAYAYKNADQFSGSGGGDSGSGGDTGGGDTGGGSGGSGGDSGGGSGGSGGDTGGGDTGGGGGPGPVLNRYIALDYFSYDINTGLVTVQWVENDLQPGSTVNLRYYSDVIGDYVTVTSVGQTTGLNGMPPTYFDSDISFFAFDSYPSNWILEVDGQFGAMGILPLRSAPVYT